MNSEPNRSIERIQHYWNSRAHLGQRAGSRDVIAKLMEIEAIAKYVADGMKMLEFGCGNGMTAIELAKRFNVEILGLDYASEMVEAARTLADREILKGSVHFEKGDIRMRPDMSERFDLIYTERVLINLKDWEAQKMAIEYITSLLKPSGLYVMCENSQNGLEKINVIREQIGLDKIEPPWHNIYFRDEDLSILSIPWADLEAVNCYSSTYYFLSRIVNAWLAELQGREPDYEAPVNKLAFIVPSFGDMAQGRIWLWRRSAE